MGAENLIPNLIVHEFEDLLFSKPERSSYCGLSNRAIQRLCDIRAEVESPKYINNSPHTAPSKRILKIYPEYRKLVDGYNIAKDIALIR